jgi:HAAS
MPETVLDHPLIRSYLRDLTAALASLPPLRATELRGQIAAHLAEELPPGATDSEVADAIGRMGTPSDLAREAGARRTFRAMLKRRSWKFWTSTSAAIAVAGVAIGMLVSVQTAPALSFDGGYGWWYRQDSKHAVESEAAGYDQLTVPVRWHQRQGYYIEISNESGYTQTVLGDADSLFWPDRRTARLEVSTLTSPSGTPPDVAQQDRYALPVSIPPGQSRFLRVLWTSQDFCVQKNGTFGATAIVLRVRVGWITRTETIGLPTEFALTGTSDYCPASH